MKVSDGIYMSSDSQWKAVNDHPSVAMSKWWLFRMILGRWEFVANHFTKMAEVRSFVNGKVSRSREAELIRWHK